MSGLSQPISTTVSEPVFGRKKELKLISEALRHYGRSATSCIFIEGAAGIGKTTLIRKALEDYPDHKTFKLYGKFENHRENTPYSALKQAFFLWSQQILLLPDDEFDSLKENATSALQMNISAVTDVFEELEVFFSRKNISKNTYAGYPHQIQARFYYFLKKFFRSVTGNGYRLIIFLDDLQWADKASLLLLEELAKPNDIPGLVLISASRSTDENTDYRGTRFPFKDLDNVTIIPLRPLTKTSVGNMVPAQWNFSRQNLLEFRNYLWLESGGNPFRISEILKIIQRENLIPLNTEDPVFWENLPRLSSGEDAVSFIREQLRNLPFDQLKILSTGSCLGYSFDPQLLNKIFSLPEGEISRHLTQLTKRDLLIRKKNVFVFTHDTIFSAAHSLISNAEKCDIHQRTGLYLLRGLNDYENQDFFLAVNHLNKAHELAGSAHVYSDEQILLNIHAAKLAIRNSAFGMAYSYYSFADKLSTEKKSSIEVHDPILAKLFESDIVNAEALRFNIIFGYAETSFLLQKFEAALDFSQQILGMECTRHQRLQATLIKMMICSALVYQKDDPQILLDGIASLEQMLCHYGICIPAEREKIKRESAKDCRILIKKAAGLDPNDEFTKLINTDQEYHDLMNLVTTSMTLMYFVDPYKNLYMVSKTLLLNLREGFAPLTPVLFAASFFTGFFSEKNRSLAHFLGQLSLKMIEKEPFKRYSYMVHYIAALNFFPWENHYRVCVNKLEEGAQHAIEAGDTHYASFCHTINRIMDTYRGKNLIQHLQDCAKVEKEHHVFFISGTDRAISSYLTGEQEGFDKGNFLFPEEVLTGAEYNLICRYNLLLAKEKLNYFANCYDAALAAGEECDMMEYVGEGYQIELEHFLFYSLSLLQSAYVNPKRFRDVLKKVEPKLKEFERLSAFKSGNYLHKVYLLKAEIAKCKADFEQATLLYDLAIQEAKEQEFIHHAAIAAERAFEYYRSKGRINLARMYLKKSLKYYRDWGAMAKVEQLKKVYPLLADKKKSSTIPSHFTRHYEVLRKVLERSVPGNENSLPELGKYLVSLILDQANAKKAGILLFQQGIWKVVAIAPADDGVVDQPLHQLKEKLPVGILNYSIKKVEKIVLQELSKEGLFVSDPYLKKEQPENITIFPIRQNEETIGLVYLEDCRILSEVEKDLFLMLIELVSTTFASAVYYENNEILNKELKLQERNKIEAVIESQEKERQRIARELHDSLGQILALSKINLTRINTASIEGDNRILLNQVLNLIDESCREVRTISHNLMPPDLDNKNLTDILQNLVNKNRQTPGITYVFDAHDFNDDISIACKFTLYRVLQEILQNIIKHASASQVNISLGHNGGFVNLLVEDNGRGFDTSLTNLGIGLKNIHSRIKLLNGYLDIDSSINNGTIFNVSIPLKS